MKAFVIPSFFLEPWDDLEDIISVSQPETSDPASDYTTPHDEFPD